MAILLNLVKDHVGRPMWYFLVAILWDAFTFYQWHVQVIHRQLFAVNIDSNYQMNGAITFFRVSGDIMLYNIDYNIVYFEHRTQ